jgi:8-oxo-dGTP diphosphatase
VTRYVVGFLFDPDGDRVVLIRKASKPGQEWQAGLLNGLGGKIEPGEDAYAAIRREVREEAGVDVTAWELFAVLQGQHSHVACFRAFDELALKAKTMEAEPVVRGFISALPGYRTVPNLQWLVPFARYVGPLTEPILVQEV